MPKIDNWTNLPPGVRRYLIDRMHERFISVTDLNQLRLWMESEPEVPETDWYKDFGTFKICGRGLDLNLLISRKAVPGAGMGYKGGDSGTRIVIR